MEMECPKCGSNASHLIADVDGNTYDHQQVFIMDLRLAWPSLRSAVTSWLDNRCPSMGAAIAYYAAFSLAPLLLLIIAVAGLAFGREAAQGAIVAQLSGLIGTEGAAALEAMIQSASKPGASAFASAVGIGALVLAATGAVGEIQSALNLIWKARPRKESALQTILRRRLLSLSLAVVMGFLLMISLVVSAALAAWSDYLAGLVSGFDLILWTVNIIVSFSVITALFAMVFKILPDVPIAWRDVWSGAIVTALLFTFGKFIIGAYIGNSSITSTHGAAAALVIVLLWVYYTSQILLFGAELAHAYTEHRDSRRVGRTHQ
jgi:membrane protein